MIRRSFIFGSRLASSLVQPLFIIGVAFSAGFLGGIFVQSTLLTDAAATYSSFLLQESEKKRIAPRRELERLAQRGYDMTFRIEKQGIPVAGAVAVRRVTGFGVLVTTNGWVVTSTAEALSEEAIQLRDRNGRLFAVQRIVRDPASPLVFIKLKLKNDLLLNPASFETTPDGSVWSDVFIYSWEEMRSVVLSPRNYQRVDQRATFDETQESFQLQKFYNAQSAFEYPGMPVFRHQGILVGITMERGIVPSFVIDGAVRSLLKNQSIIRTDALFEYIDRARSQDNSNGAFVRSVKSEKKKVDTHTLKEGDVIISLNNENIDHAKNIGEVIQSYRVGDELSARVIRGGHEVIVSIPLYATTYY